MTRYSLAVRTSNVTIANACLEIIAGAAKACRLAQIDLTLVAATASTFGLGRPAAKGITPTTPVGLLTDQSADPSAGQATVALAWATGPTVPVQFIRRITMPATIGAQEIWTFGGGADMAGQPGRSGLVIPAGTSLVLWNLSATSVADVNVILDE